MEKKAAGGEEEICRRKNGTWKCKNASADNKYHYCEKHYKLLEMKRKSLPQDEQLCSRTGSTGRWRCKDFRMNSESKWCERHYNRYIQKYKKKRKRGKKVTEEDKDTSHTIVGGGSAKFWTKRKNVERTELSGELNSLTKTREPVVETRALKLRKMVTEGGRFDGNGGCSSATGIETNKDSNCSKRKKKVTENADPSLDETRGIQPANSEDTCGGIANFKRKRKNVERAEESGMLESLTKTREHSNCSKGREKVPATTNDTSDCDAIIGDLESLTKARGPVVELQSLEHYKRKCFEFSIDLERKNVEHDKTQVELEIKKVQLEKKNVEHDKTQGELEIKKVQLEKKNVKHEKTQVELEEKHTEHEKTQVELEKKHAEHEKTQVELETKKVELEKKNEEHEKTQVELEKKNVELEKTQVELEKKTVELEKTKLELEKKNIELEKKKVEFTELQGKLAEVETSLTAANDMLTMNNWSRSKDLQEIKWKSVCALYRQHIYASREEISAKGLYYDSDTFRCTTLAMFLMDEDCKGDIKKCLKELAAFDAEAVDSCKRLAKRYSTYVFNIYQNGSDPFFPSMCNCHPRRSNC